MFILLCAKAMYICKSRVLSNIRQFSVVKPQFFKFQLLRNEHPFTDIWDLTVLVLLLF